MLQLLGEPGETYVTSVQNVVPKGAMPTGARRCVDPPERRPTAPCLNRDCLGARGPVEPICVTPPREHLLPLLDASEVDVCERPGGQVPVKVFAAWMPPVLEAALMTPVSPSCARRRGWNDPEAMKATSRLAL